MIKVLAVLFTSIIIQSTNVQKKPEIKFAGVKIFVTDLQIAEDFYTNNLGLQVSARNAKEVELKTNQWPITLALAKERSADGYPSNARTGLSFQTHKLLPQIDNFRKMGVKLHDSLLSRNGVGISIPFEDPFGNVMTILEVQIRDVERFEGVKVYNTGVTIADMDAATAFYEGVLGFEEWSRDYLPDALPLKHFDGSFAFMIHYKKGLKKNPAMYGKNSQIVLVMSTSNLDDVKSKLKSKGIQFESKKDRIIIQDQEGNLTEIEGS
ncbi:MAG: VOC family protein [Cyclobacteriaceae bacterium]